MNINISLKDIRLSTNPNLKELPLEMITQQEKSLLANRLIFPYRNLKRNILFYMRSVTIQEEKFLSRKMLRSEALKLVHFNSFSSDSVKLLQESQRGSQAFVTVLRNSMSNGGGPLPAFLQETFGAAGQVTSVSCDFS